MPTEFTAIVQRAEPGGDLACRALDHHFEEDGATVHRGVISYYATGALAQAGTIGSWMSAMDRAAQDDLRRGRITSFHLPSLQIAGDATARVPGIALTSGGAPATGSVLSRDEGCVALDGLMRGYRLHRVPVSPDDYAAMLRARGEQPTLGLPPGFPPDMTGKVVMVQVRPDRAPVFVRDDVCRDMKGK